VKPKTKILIIAGSDSSGGAGIQADIKTVTSLGGYAMTAVTAITAQNTTGVLSIVSIPPKEIENQIEERLLNLTEEQKIERRIDQ
jgi:hydroxymethylpyrimidine/phosphomethylpyrimidine kinase